MTMTYNPDAAESPAMRVPDWTYVKKLHNDLQWEMQGFHTKIKEIEALKYYETRLPTDPKNNPTGRANVRIGLTDQLMETVKASILANPPIVHIEPMKTTREAAINSTEREKYHQAKLNEMLGGYNAPNLISELIDSQLLGLGVLKSGEAVMKWGNPKDRKRRRGESSYDHVERVKAIKKLGGHPSDEVIVHPLSFFARPGKGSKLEECIEHSYKSRKTVYDQYELWDTSYRGGQRQQINQTTKQVVRTMPGMPNQFIRTVPQGVNITNYVLVTEYYNPECYQIYINGNKVYEETGDDVSVCYFIAPGRSSSSKDPDKYAISIAENLRHNEPEIDNMLSRMVEATDLIVNKRLTLEVPEGAAIPEDQNEDGTTRPRTWEFNAEYAEALPPGSSVVDPYEGTHNVFGGMPVLQLIMNIATEHSVNPIMNGVSPGAAGSGYRDNSLFLIARSKYQYLVQSAQNCLASFFEFQEWLICNKIKQDCYCGGVKLSPSDIKDFPAKITVEFKPKLPQNLIAEGQFWESQRASGNVSRRYVREVGLNIENPDDMDNEVILEHAQDQLIQYLIMDVMGQVLGAGASAGGQGPMAGGLVDQFGQPMQGANSNAPNSMANLLGMGAGAGGRNGAGREVGRQLGGFTRQGQPRQPTIQPGATIPT